MRRHRVQTPVGASSWSDPRPIRSLSRAHSMPETAPVDYYEVLQISSNAEPETIHRVYRLLAQRFHPDNKETGSESRFRLITEAYQILSDPEQRARYDLVHQEQQRQRWHLVAAGA